MRQCDCSGNWSITWDYEEPWWKRVYCDSDTFKIHPESGPIWKAPSSICHSDSSTVTKSNPDTTIYTTAHNETISGSDYWNSVTRNWENVPHTLTNMQKELDEIKSTLSNTLGEE